MLVPEVQLTNTVASILESLLLGPVSDRNQFRNLLYHVFQLFDNHRLTIFILLCVEKRESKLLIVGICF